MDTIRLGIVGYGNLGKGVELSVKQNHDMELIAVFTRRDPDSVKTRGTPVYSVNEISLFREKIDVMILCGGSAKDLPEWSPKIASMFNVVDSFDTHAVVSEHFDAVDRAAVSSGTLGLVSGGWDPGLFSMMRVLGNAILPSGTDTTFWGPGVSQGHSDAVRRIPGVVDARQYTLPVVSALEKARNGQAGNLSAREKHTRLCYVVAAENADKDLIRDTIVHMPFYFDEYDTTVIFIDEETMKRDHNSMPHGGSVIRHGVSGGEMNQTMEFTLNLQSNPEFTSSVLVACARAVFRLHREGKRGAITMLDLPISTMSGLSREELLKHYL